MKRYIARQVLIVQLLALALTLSLPQPPVHAQEMTAYIVLLPSVGLAPGQKLRFTLFNPEGEPVRAQAQAHHSGGIMVGMGDGSVRFISGGTFHSFDLNRSDIPVPGEEGTGRLQLRASCYIRVAQPWRKTDGLAISMETIEIADGTSNTILVSEVIPTPSGGGDGGLDVLIGGSTRDVLMGIVPGQTLRVTIFNPPLFGSQTGSPPQPHTANGHIKVFDKGGVLLAQSEDAVIPPGDSHSFDFNRDAFPESSGTNRQQTRIKPFFEFRSGRLTRVLASFEIVDNRTGKTQVLEGQQCLVFFLGGVPDN